MPVHHLHMVTYTLIPYTFSKWNGEELCKLYSNVYDLPLAICRFYNVYGDGQLSEGAYCTVLGIFERQYKAGEPLTITSDGEQKEILQML